MDYSYLLCYNCIDPSSTDIPNQPRVVNCRSLQLVRCRGLLIHDFVCVCIGLFKDMHSLHASKSITVRYDGINRHILCTAKPLVACLTKRSSSNRLPYLHSMCLNNEGRKTCYPRNTTSLPLRKILRSVTHWWALIKTIFIVSEA